MFQIFAWIYFFDSSILHFGDLPSSTDNVPWQFAAVLASHGLCAFIVQVCIVARNVDTRLTWSRCSLLIVCIA
jgi:hypothetical protein